MEQKMYGVIVEFKEEQPLIIESYLLTYEKAQERMKELSINSRVIRVAIFQAKYEIGNRTLLPEENN